MKLEDVLQYAVDRKIVRLDRIKKDIAENEKDKAEIEKLIYDAVGNKILKKLKGGYKISQKGRRILKSKQKEAPKNKPGKDKAKDKLSDKPEKNNNAKITEAWNDVSYIIERHELPGEFPQKALEELKDIPEHLEDLDIGDRLDLRDKDIITIDGADAKDFDDAIHIEKKGDGVYTLGVHIADVGSFIKRGSALDDEAMKRGNSIYLIDTVIPMFPFEVSNGICSLKEGVTRYTMSAIMDIDSNGNVIEASFSNSVIKSKKRCTYQYVQDVLDGKDEAPQWLKSLLEKGYELMKILNQRRINEGSIEFDFTETKIELDEDREPVKIYQYKRVDSHRIVEEFMLLANRCVAEYFTDRIDAIYRVHDIPDEEKLQNFERIAYNRGYRLQRDSHGEIDYKEFFKSIKGKPDEKLLSTLLLRSMKQAFYDTDNIGHYGLAFQYYTHFTSPIRRYSDLEVHRTLKALLAVPEGEEEKAAQKARINMLEKAAERCSKRERIAVDAERELIKLKAARFMHDKVGMRLNGLVSGVTDFGVFVETTDYGVEGLVRFQDMDGYFVYKEEDMAVQERGGKQRRYQLGDKVIVEVKSVNIERLFIDFIFTESEHEFPDED